MGKILFLDDMPERHKAFVAKVGMDADVEVYRAWTAQQAIDMLQTTYFAQVFLDHDLSHEDIMCTVGGVTKEPTGMAVVDFIVRLHATFQPQHVIIHSCNEPAAREMERRLREIQPSILVTRMPFPALLGAMV